VSKLNQTISRVLIAGLVASVVFLAIGIVVSIARPDLAGVHQTSVRAIPGAIAHLEPAGFFDLGLLLLVATPFARVVALFVGFTRRRMWLFASISVFVLAGLVASALLGLTA
jgi:uncharacterized membrane protein